ncbi:MAG: signal peptidase II [Lachnospiraceae bacterium]|nr:signal peptidase II [Lachnospiraceae bacterium]
MDRNINATETETDEITGKVAKKTLERFSPLCFFLVPMITVCANLKYVKNGQEAFSYFLFILCDFFICVFLFTLLRCFFSPLSRKGPGKFFLFTSVGVLLDQVIKVVISFYGGSFYLLGKYVQISPTKNENQMAVLNRFDIEIPGTIILVAKLILVFGILFVYFRFDRKNSDLKVKNQTGFVNMFFVLFLAAGISNFLDSAFWGYTLDYMRFWHLTVYDLKDFYVDAAIGGLVIWGIEKMGRKVV